MWTSLCPAIIIFGFASTVAAQNGGGAYPYPDPSHRRTVSLCDETVWMNTINDTSVDIRFTHTLAFDRAALVNSGSTIQKTCQKIVTAPPGHVVRLAFREIHLNDGRMIRVYDGTEGLGVGEELCRISPDAPHASRGQPPEDCISTSTSVIIEFECASNDMVSSFMVQFSFDEAGCDNPLSMDFTSTSTSPLYGTCGADGAYSVCNRFRSGPIMDASGFIDDGSNGQNYNAMLDCMRAIEVPFGQIELIFTSVDLGVGDVISVYDPGDTRQNGMTTVIGSDPFSQELRTVDGLAFRTEPLLQIHFGDIDAPRVLHSFSRRLLIRFTTNGFGSGRGWGAKWTSGTGTCLNPASPEFSGNGAFQPLGACGLGAAYSFCKYQHPAASVVSTLEAYTALNESVAAARRGRSPRPSLDRTDRFGDERADGIIRASHGVVDSGNFFPSGRVPYRRVPYSTNLHCGRQFAARYNERVCINFNLLSIGRSDRLSVYDGDVFSGITAESLMAEFGETSSAPVRVCSRTPYLYIALETDPGLRTRGWGVNATWEMGAAGCAVRGALNYNASAAMTPFGACDFNRKYSVCSIPGTSIAADTGYLTAGNFDGSYGANLNCYRTLQASRREFTMRMQFVNISLAPGDFIRVFDRARNETHPVLWVVPRATCEQRPNDPCTACPAISGSSELGADYAIGTEHCWFNHTLVRTPTTWTILQ